MRKIYSVLGKLFPYFEAKANKPKVEDKRLREIIKSLCTIFIILGFVSFALAIALFKTLPIWVVKVAGVWFALSIWVMIFV